MPKLNFIRENTLGKVLAKKTSYCYMPDERIKKKLSELEIFSKEKIYLLSDAIINIKNFRKEKKKK